MKFMNLDKMWQENYVPRGKRNFNEDLEIDPSSLSTLTLITMMDVTEIRLIYYNPTVRPNR